MFKDILTIDYLLVLLISFFIIVIFNGLFNAILISLLITISIYLYNKYLSEKFNKYLKIILLKIKRFFSKEF